jgi:hypothetical protein
MSRTTTITLAAIGVIIAAILSLWAVDLLVMAGLWPSW